MVGLHLVKSYNNSKRCLHALHTQQNKPEDKPVTTNCLMGNTGSLSPAQGHMDKNHGSGWTQ